MHLVARLIIVKHNSKRWTHISYVATLLNITNHPSRRTAQNNATIGMLSIAVVPEEIPLRHFGCIVV